MSLHSMTTQDISVRSASGDVHLCMTATAYLVYYQCAVMHTGGDKLSAQYAAATLAADHTNTTGEACTVIDYTAAPITATEEQMNY